MCAELKLITSFACSEEMEFSFEKAQVQDLIFSQIPLTASVQGYKWDLLGVNSNLFALGFETLWQKVQ